MIRLYLKKPNFWPFLDHFWSILGHFGPKNEKFENPLQVLYSPRHKLSNDIWHDYTRRKPIFDHFWSFFGPFWAILGTKTKILKKLYKICIHLPISFPTIYDTTIFEETQFLTIFGPFWAILGHFGHKNENFDLFLQNLYSPLH